MTTLIRSICLALLLTSSTIASARENIHFSCMQPADTSLFQFLLPLYQEAFDTLGFDFTMSSNPVNRETTTMKTGVYDGLCLRPNEFTAVLNELLKVDVVVWAIELQGWGHSQDMSVNLWTKDTLKGYRVGHRLGFKRIGRSLKRHKVNVSEKTVTTASGLKMLAAKRLDIFIDAKTAIDDAKRDVSLPQPIYFLGTFERLNAFPYLHKRHRHLAAPLAVELKRLLTARGNSSH